MVVTKDTKDFMDGKRRIEEVIVRVAARRRITAATREKQLKLLRHCFKKEMNWKV